MRYQITTRNRKNFFKLTLIDYNGKSIHKENKQLVGLLKELLARVDGGPTAGGQQSGGYDNWVDSQFDDGILYYSYRGYYGSSSINPDSGWSSGSETPFALTVTCGTGDFNGTSDSEDFVRVGSASNLRAATEFQQQRPLSRPSPKVTPRHRLCGS